MNGHPLRLYLARFGILLLGWSAISAPAVAGYPEEWNQQLQEVIGKLRSADWRSAHRSSQQILDGMNRFLVPSEGAGRGIGMILMCRALAEAGLRREREAVWDWHIAQQLDPRLERWNLTEFGVAGALLGKHRLGSDPPPPAIEADTPAADGVSVPKRISTPAPDYPEGGRQLHLRASVAIRVVIGVDGHATHPRLEDGRPFETFTLSASDAIRDWRFEPARRGEEAVPFSWKLTINFTLPSR